MKKVIIAITLFSFVNAYGQDGGIKIINNNYKHSRAMWSPVEDLILFESNMEGLNSLYIINSNGENVKRVTSLGHEDWLAAWSPDGKRIAYSSKRGDKYQLFIYNLNNDTHRQLTTSEFSEYGPSWSPDGKQIAYSSKLNGRNVREIFIIDVDGKNKKRLTLDKKVNGLPVFSVDGESIFYQSTAGSNSSSKPDIFAYHLPTSKTERITYSNTGGGIDPFIHAPNGKLAFFTAGSGSPNGHGTYWINLETREMTKFDVKAKNPGHPTWNHNGNCFTIIDRKEREIYVYDIENSKPIKVTDRTKITGN